MTMRPIFISYRRSWKAEVEKLAECLQLHGLRVFLDYSDGSELIGASYNDELRRIIEEQSEGMLLEAKRRGYGIVHPLTEEAWGVRRFFVRAPDGNVINIVSHSDE